MSSGAVRCTFLRPWKAGSMLWRRDGDTRDGETTGCSAASGRARARILPLVGRVPGRGSVDDLRRNPPDARHAPATSKRGSSRTWRAHLVRHRHWRSDDGHAPGATCSKEERGRADIAWRRRLAVVVHWALYFAILAQAATGFTATYLFGGAGRVHVLLWNVILRLLALHLAGAAYHLTLRDEVVARMLPARRRLSKWFAGTAGIDAERLGS